LFKVLKMLGLVNYDSDSGEEYGNQLNKSAVPTTIQREASSITTVPISDSTSLTDFDPVTVERIKHYYELKVTTGFDFTDNIRGKKDFGNPQILQKVIDHYHIYQVSRI
jgi:hypothetical protein